VLVIDDGSTDGTVASARTAGAEVLQLRPNQGKGAALLAGFEAALLRGYDAVLTLDADGQHYPGEIPAFLEAFHNTRTDLIIGQRVFSRMPPLRRVSNTLGTRVLSWALGQQIPDNQSGYRLISRRLMEAMRKPVESGFEFEVEMIVVCLQRGFLLGWVPILTIYAGESSHIHPLRHAVKFLRISLRARSMLQTARISEAIEYTCAASDGLPRNETKGMKRP